MKSSAVQLPPLDANRVPLLADADLERRVQTLRKILAEESSPSFRRMAQGELAEIAREIGWAQLEAIQ